MKNTLLLIMCLLLAACTKTKNTVVTNTVIKQDSIYLSNSLNLVGRWVWYDTITIDNDFFTQSGWGMFRYVSTPDTIYQILFGNEIYAKYGYRISANNDSLYLLPTASPTTSYYHRIY